MYYVVLYTECRGKQTYAKTIIITTLRDLRNCVRPSREELEQLHSHVLQKAKKKTREPVHASPDQTKHASSSSSSTGLPVKRKIGKRKGPLQKTFAAVGPLSLASAQNFSAALSHGTRGLPSKFNRMIDLLATDPRFVSGPVLYIA